MKRETLIKMIVITKETDRDGTGFSAKCPIRDCDHEIGSEIHYGDTEEAKDATVSKILAHIRIVHTDIKIED